MTIRSLAEVGVRLEEAVARLPGEPDSPEEHYERYEEIAIAILDSEFTHWPEGALEQYLKGYLSATRARLKPTCPR
mgnify:CR=1 FL=1|jgi:hypothetical protein